MTTVKTAKNRYVEAVGRRKTSTARVRIIPESAKASFVINDRDVKEYFPTGELYKIVSDPFTKGKLEGKYEISVKVNGGGTHSQAEAIRHGISRVLIELDEELRIKLKKLGFLKRDPRMKDANSVSRKPEKPHSGQSVKPSKIRLIGGFYVNI